MDPRSKLLVVVDVGSRTLAMAQRVVHQVTEVLAPGCVPLFLTDGLKDYATALLTHFGSLDATRAAPGQRPDAQTAMDAAARAALRASGEVVPAPAHRGRQAPRGVRHPAGHRAGPGDVWLDHQHAFVERLNLDIRQRVAAIGRRVNTLCQGEAGLRDQLALFQVYHNFVLPHASLRQPLLIPRTHQRPWLSEGVAAVYTGDGGGIDRARVVAHRGPVLPGAAVAATASAATIWAGRGACKGAGWVCLSTGKEV